MGGIDEILQSGRFPGVAIRGTRKGHHANVHLKESEAGTNPHLATAVVGQGRYKSPARYETEQKKIVQAKRKAASATRRARRGTKREDGEMRLKGSIPLSLFNARMKEHGKDYWTREGDQALKRDGLLFEE